MSEERVAEYTDFSIIASMEAIMPTLLYAYANSMCQLGVVVPQCLNCGTGIPRPGSICKDCRDDLTPSEQEEIVHNRMRDYRKTVDGLEEQFQNAARCTDEEKRRSTELQIRISEVVSQLKKAGRIEEDLDDIVIERAEEVAGSYNNEGLWGQVKFLLREGCPPEIILARAGGR